MVPAMIQSRNVLDVRGLCTQFFTSRGVAHAVDNVSFSIRQGETLGLVGESGCGKTVTALSLIRLVPYPGRIVAGEIQFDGVDVMGLSEKEVRKLRGQGIGFIFQDPMTALNPVFTVGEQIAETIRLNLGTGKQEARVRAIELLHMVGIPMARRRAGDYPHQFSGGMRQRAMIAIALSCNPKLVIADEPTTALDVTVQAQILELLRTLSEELHTAVLLITHDLGVAAGMCDRISVMYAGRVVELGLVDDVFEHPQMPYTWGLLECLPKLDRNGVERLSTIEGVPPSLLHPRDQCRFHDRCEYAAGICRTEEPQLLAREGSGQFARCWGTEPKGWIA